MINRNQIGTTKAEESHGNEFGYQRLRVIRRILYVKKCEQY